MKPSIYFGHVVNVKDPEKKLRIQCEIYGLTDGIQDLPWYYPWYGVHHLPEVNDIVPVMILDSCFTSGMYNNPIQNMPYNISDEDYETFLQIYKRGGVELSYSNTGGIQFINGDSSAVIKDTIELFCSGTGIQITPQSINLGGSDHVVPYGDEVVEVLKQILELLTTLAKTFDITWLTTQWIPACSTPYTLPLITPMTAAVNALQQLCLTIPQLQGVVDANTLCSQKVKLS